MAVTKAPVALSIIIILIILVAIRSCSPFRRDLEWAVPLDADAALTISAAILGQSRVRGCGDLRVVHVYALLKEVRVECGDGRDYRLVWHPVFKIDGRTPDHLVWDRPSLEGLFCVKDESGSWHAAYIDSEKAVSYAASQSLRTGRPTRIYRSDSTIFGETVKSEDGTWHAILSLDHLDDPEERRGCELAEELD